MRPTRRFMEPPASVDAPFYDPGAGPLAPARFVSRPNRFLVLAHLGTRHVRVACADPGRLRELLRPGVRLLLRPATAGSSRRTRFTLALVRHAGRWVCLVPALANAVFAAALARGGVPGMRGFRVLAREVVHGRSRLDLLLLGRGERWLVEVKSATLVERGLALFPDAPTSRGTRHVRELERHAAGGGRAAVVFLVQRADARAFAAHAGHDPAFAAALRAARGQGVRVLAFACRVTPRGVTLVRRLPVRLSAPRAAC